MQIRAVMSFLNALLSTNSMHNARSHCITKTISHASARTELEIAREREGALASVYKQILTCIYECCLSAGECCGNALGGDLALPTMPPAGLENIQQSGHGDGGLIQLPLDQ